MHIGFLELLIVVAVIVGVGVLIFTFAGKKDE